MMVVAESGVHGHFVRPLVGGRTLEHVRVSCMGGAYPKDGEVSAIPRSGCASVTFRPEVVAELSAAFTGQGSAASRKRVKAALKRRAQGMLARHGLKRIKVCIEQPASAFGLFMCVGWARTAKRWDEWAAIALEILGDLVAAPEQLEPGACWEAFVDLLEDADDDSLYQTEFFPVVECTCNKIYCQCK